MWTRRRFLLHNDLHAIEKVNGREICITIPGGEIVEVINGPYEEYIRFVEFRWRRRNFLAFAVDLQACGEDVVEQWV